MISRITYILLSSLIVAALIVVPASGKSKGTSGVLACGGDHNTHADLTRQTTTAWTFNNFNSSANITINRIRVFFYTEQGVNFDSDVHEYPPAWANVLNIDANDPPILPPVYGVVRLNSEDLYPFILDQNQQPYYGSLLQMYVEWEADQKLDVPLKGYGVVRSYPVEGWPLLGKHSIACVATNLP